MAQNAYVGLGVDGNSTSSSTTAVFDNVSVTSFGASVGGLWGTISSAANGSAVGGAQVKLLQWNTLKATIASDVNGRFGFSNLAAGAYDVKISASGFGTSISTGVVVLPFVSTTLNISLTAPGSVAGTVTQTDGVTPITGALVQAVVGAVSAGSGTSDSNGNYVISGLNAASYQVQASATGYVTAVQSASVAASSTTTMNFALQGPGSGAVTYVYDALGRLAGVINPSGDTATYNYDAVGNLLSISRHSSAQLSIITFTPGKGSVGTAVTIYGTGFSSTASQDTVQFNGVTATVQSVSATQLIVTVPPNATTGPITVTTSAGTVTSSSSFTIQ
jgi:YD repeat-containing protein